MSAPPFSVGPLGLVVSDTPSANNTFHLYLVDTDRRKIAALWGKSEQKLANGYLWSAAPELYALLAILEWGDDQRPGCPFCGMGKRTGHLGRCQLSDALAKARGEQS